MNRLLAVLLCLLLAQQTLALRIYHLEHQVNTQATAQPETVAANATTNATSDAKENSGLFFEVTKALKGAIEQSQADADKNQTTAQVLQNRLNELLEDAREETVGELNKTDDSGKPAGEEIENTVLSTVENALNAGKVGLNLFGGQLKDALNDAGNNTGLFSDAPIGGYVNGTKSNERGADGFVDQINNQYGIISKLVEDSVKTGLGDIQGLLGVNATSVSNEDHPAAVKPPQPLVDPSPQPQPSSETEERKLDKEENKPHISKAEQKEKKKEEEKKEKEEEKKQEEQEKEEKEQRKEEEKEKEQEQEKEGKKHEINPHKKPHGNKSE